MMSGPAPALRLPRPPALALAFASAVAVAGCSLLPPAGRGGDGPAAGPAVDVVENTGAPRPRPRPGAAPVPPPAGARTAAALDTTTEAARSAALAPAPAAGRRLGSAIVSLGAPAEPGFWLRTPLVTAPVRGRVVHAATGASVQVELRPAAAAGTSQLSLPAFRLLGLPLTALPEVEVYAF